MMSCRLFVKLAVILAVVTDTAFGGVAEFPQRTASFQCILDEKLNSVNATFMSELNGDPINHVFALVFNETTQQDDYVFCNFYKDGGFMTVHSAVSLDDPFLLVSENPCGIQVDDTGEIFTWRLALRQTERFFKTYDRDYQVTCDASQAYSNVVKSSIAVEDPIFEYPDVIVPDVTLEVLRQRSIANINSGYIRSSVCQIGENMKLRATLDYFPFRDDITSSGLVLKDTRVAPFENLLLDSNDDLNFQLVNDIGCALNPNVLSMEYGWTLTSSNDILPAVYETGVFQCRRTFPSDELWFMTYFDFCFGLDERMNKCNDTCDYYTNSRKRRQVSDKNGESGTVAVHVTIIDEETDVEKASTTEMSTTLIIAIATGTALVLVALVTAVVFLCVVRQKKRFTEDSSMGADSRASSERKLPVL